MHFRCPTFTRQCYNQLDRDSCGLHAHPTQVEAVPGQDRSRCMVELALMQDTGDPRRLSPDENEKGLGHFHYRVGSRSHKWRPATDVFETEDAFVVRVEIAGMRDSEFTILLDERTVTIQGHRPDRDERRAFHQMEIRFGEFSTSVEVHWPIDPQAVEAKYTDGILRLVLPKALPHNIKIGK